MQLNLFLRSEERVGERIAIIIGTGEYYITLIISPLNSTVSPLFTFRRLR
jgi:hypothetical protein